MNTKTQIFLKRTANVFIRLYWLIGTFTLVGPLLYFLIGDPMGWFDLLDDVTFDV